MLRKSFLSLVASTALLGAERAHGVTVYTSAVGTAALAQYTVASTDQTILQPPAIPQGLAKNVPIQLYDGGMDGLSVPVPGGFLGFSIELSVASTLLGENSTHLRPEFLNYCAVLESRSGAVTIRVGGNSQDRATINPEGNPSGRTIDKYKAIDAGPTATPEIHFTPDLFRAMVEIGKLVKINWFFGIPFLNLNPNGNAGIVYREAIAALGSSLLGLQLANEPDLYGPHKKKWDNYSMADFFNETTFMIGNIPVDQKIIVGPSTCCNWHVDELLNAGYMDQFTNQLAMIAVMHYPDNNCGLGANRDPQTLFPQYLNHNEVINVIRPYYGAAQRAIAAGKPFMMMETNTASCGGFPGISDSFGASLWGVDYSLHMAHANFSYALMHFGGQNVYYNPFTPPPTNQLHLRKWSTGSIFYAHIVVAEALGKSNNARVLDMMIDNGNVNRAGYVIYEGGRPMRVALVNYVQDPGNSDYFADIRIGGINGLPMLTPPSVRVKYLRAPSVSDKYNITWAGQTMGNRFESDGRLFGDAVIETVNCDTVNGICSIPVPAPSVALVFLNDDALQVQSSDVAATFGTSVVTERDVISIDYESVKVSNGRGGGDPLGMTSRGEAPSDAAPRRPPVALATLIGGVLLGLFGWMVVV